MSSQAATAVAAMAAAPTSILRSNAADLEGRLGDPQHVRQVLHLGGLPFFSEAFSELSVA